MPSAHLSPSASVRTPIHLGSQVSAPREPVLLLHPFLLSQMVWETVAQQVADTGPYEVFAPTLANHNGGPSAGAWFLSSAVLADHVERQLDDLGWDTAHIVGNSLGGWVAFELESRGRARSVTAIAPAGGWTRWSPTKYEVISKFVVGMPLFVLARLLGPRVMGLPLSRRLATLAISASPEGVTDRQLAEIIDDAGHCPAYFQMLVKALLQPGLLELAQSAVPVHLVLCEKDRILPPSRYSPHFTKHLPAGTRVTMLDGVGHVPMLEAPGRISELITDFIEQHRAPIRAINPPAS